jgi:hypothetical protein
MNPPRRGCALEYASLKNVRRKIDAGWKENFASGGNQMGNSVE